MPPASDRLRDRAPTAFAMLGALAGALVFARWKSAPVSHGRVFAELCATLAVLHGLQLAGLARHASSSLVLATVRLLLVLAAVQFARTDLDAVWGALAVALVLHDRALAGSRPMVPAALAVAALYAFAAGARGPSVQHATMVAVIAGAVAAAQPARSARTLASTGTSAGGST